MNTKLHAICDSKGRPLNLFVTADRSVTTSARGLCWAISQTWNGCSETEATMQTGSETR